METYAQTKIDCIYATIHHLNQGLRKFMKTPFVVIVTALISSCATHPSNVATKPLMASAMISGPKNDLLPWANPQSKLGTRVNDNPTFITFPLGEAAECNIEKTACKHGIVKTELKISATRSGDHLVKLSGNLHTEMGRSEESKSDFGGSSQMFRKSLPEDVEIIGEFKNDHPFEKVVGFNEEIVLDGLAGVKVAVEVD